MNVNERARNEKTRRKVLFEDKVVVFSEVTPFNLQNAINEYLRLYAACAQYQSGETSGGFKPGRYDVKFTDSGAGYAAMIVFYDLCEIGG